MRARVQKRLLVLVAAALARRAAADDDAATTGGDAIAGGVGRKVGLVKIGNNRETGDVSFWIAAPLGAESMSPDNFGIVAASLWNRGGWGGGESVVARRVFETRCPNSENVVVDLGSHVGYFTLLAAAHGCQTRSAELDPDFARLLRLALHANDFDAERHRARSRERSKLRAAATPPRPHCGPRRHRDAAATPPRRRRRDPDPTSRRRVRGRRALRPLARLRDGRRRPRSVGEI